MKKLSTNLSMRSPGSIISGRHSLIMTTLFVGTMQLGRKESLREVLGDYVKLLIINWSGLQRELGRKTKRVLLVKPNLEFRRINSKPDQVRTNLSNLIIIEKKWTAEEPTSIKLTVVNLEHQKDSTPKTIIDLKMEMDLRQKDNLEV